MQAAAAAAAATAATTIDHHHSHHNLQQHHHKQHSLIHQPIVLSNQHHNNHNHHHQHLSSSTNNIQSATPTTATTTTFDTASPVAGEGATSDGVVPMPLDGQLPDAERIYHHNNLHHLKTHPNHLSHHYHHHPTHSLLQQHNNSCPLNLEEPEDVECCLHQHQQQQQQTPTDSPEASSSGGSSTGEDWESGEFNLDNSTLEPHLCTQLQQPQQQSKPVNFIQTGGFEEIVDSPQRSAASAPKSVNNSGPKLSSVRKVKTSHKTTKLKTGIGSAMGGSGSGGGSSGAAALQSGNGLLPTSRVIAPQFKAKSSNIRISDGTTSAASAIGGSAVGIGGTMSAASIASRKMRWMSNMRSDPDFRDAFARNVHVVVRQQSTPKKTMINRSTPDDNRDVSTDEVDYYSAVCDTQLSVGTSPCKSPHELMALLAANRTGVVGSGVRPHRLGSGGGGGGGAGGFGGATGASGGVASSRRNSGGGVDLSGSFRSGSSSSSKSNWFSNNGSNRRSAFSANGNYKDLPDNCKVLVVAKPVESQLIGFNVVNSLSNEAETLRSVSPLHPLTTTPNDRLMSDLETTTATANNNHPTTDPAVFAEIPSASPTPLLRTDHELALQDIKATGATGKRPVSWVESRFKHRFFGRSNVVSSSQTNTKTKAITTIPWFGPPKSGTAAAGGLKRSSFSFRDIRHELQAVMRQHNRSGDVSMTTSSKSVKATSGLAADIKSKTMKKTNTTTTATATASLPLDDVREDIAQ